MKKQKLKVTKYESEDTKELKSLIFIVLGIAVIAFGLYFLTDRGLKKETKTDVSFNYDTITVGTMFNRPYDEYYVFLYSSEDDNATNYNSLFSSYKSSEDSLKIYMVDLSKNLDDKYLSEKSNPKATNPSEISIKDSALVLIKDGKISKYYETASDYEKILKVTEE